MYRVFDVKFQKSITHFKKSKETNTANKFKKRIEEKVKKNKKESYWYKFKEIILLTSKELCWD